MSRFAMLSLGLLFCAGAALVAAPAPVSRVPKGLLEQRRNAAQKAYTQHLQRIRGGQGLFHELPDWSRRWLEAEKALSNKNEDHLKALRAHLERMREAEKLITAWANSGQALEADATSGTYFRIEAEIMLLEAGGELPKQDKKVKEGEELKPLPKPGK